MGGGKRRSAGIGAPAAANRDSTGKFEQRSIEPVGLEARSFWDNELMWPVLQSLGTRESQAHARGYGRQDGAVGR
jgi:hypothetical protein